MQTGALSKEVRQNTQASARLCLLQRHMEAWPMQRDGWDLGQPGVKCHMAAGILCHCTPSSCMLEHTQPLQKVGGSLEITKPCHTGSASLVEQQSLAQCDSMTTVISRGTGLMSSRNHPCICRQQLRDVRSHTTGKRQSRKEITDSALPS